VGRVRVVFSLTLEEADREIELWREPAELDCLPQVGDAVSIWLGGFGPTAQVEERIFSAEGGAEGGVHLRLGRIKGDEKISSSDLMGQRWLATRPYYR